MSEANPCQGSVCPREPRRYIIRRNFSLAESSNVSKVIPQLSARPRVSQKISVDWKCMEHVALPRLGLNLVQGSVCQAVSGSLALAHGIGSSLGLRTNEVWARVWVWRCSVKAFDFGRPILGC